jgi:MFS family permease
MMRATPLPAGTAEPAIAGSAVAELRRHALLLAGCFLGIAVGVASLYFYTAGMFVKELGTAFGWSRGVVGSSTAVFTFGMAIAAPVWGRLADRRPPRPLICASLLAVAACFVALALMPGSTSAFLGIVLVMALLGTGCSPVTFTLLLNRAFDTARGTALGLALMGTGAGATFGPVLVAAAMAEGGWRLGYAALAATMAIAIPFVWIGLRDAASGQAIAGAGDGATPVPPPTGLTLGEAARRPVFWLLAGSFFFAAIGFGGLIVHLVSILTDAGVPRADAASTAGLIGVSVIASRVLTGLLVDRIFAGWVGAAAFALSALGCAILTFAVAHAPLGAILLGAAMGAEVDLVAYLVARYFGMRRYGSIYGVQYVAFLVGAGASPMLMGIAFDLTGSYREAQLVALGCLSVAALAMLFLPRFPDFAKR